MRFRPFYGTVLYILLYNQPEDGFKSRNMLL